MIIDSSTFWRPGQLGVAVGRATMKDGLQLTAYNKYAATLKHPQIVVDFYQERSLMMRENLLCCNKCTLAEPTTFQLQALNVGDADLQGALGSDFDYMNKVDFKAFPFDVTEYIEGLIREMPKVTHIQRDQIQILNEAKAMNSFHSYLDQTYSMIWDLFHKYRVFVNKSNVTGVRCVHTYTVFSHLKHTRKIF